MIALGADAALTQAVVRHGAMKGDFGDRSGDRDERRDGTRVPAREEQPEDREA